MQISSDLHRGLEALRVEQIADVLVAPINSGIRYNVTDGKHYMRSFGVDFNLVHRSHIKIFDLSRVNGVYSIGNGLYLGEDRDVCLIQIFSEIEFCRRKITDLLAEVPFIFSHDQRKTRIGREVYFCSILL